MKKIAVIVLFLLIAQSSYAQYKIHLLKGKKWTPNLQISLLFDIQLKRKYDKKVYKKEFKETFEGMSLYFGDKNKLTVWSESKTYKGTYKLDGRVLTLKWKQDGKMINLTFIIIDIDDDVQVWDTKRRKLLFMMDFNTGNKFILD